MTTVLRHLRHFSPLFKLKGETSISDTCGGRGAKKTQGTASTASNSPVTNIYCWIVCPSVNRRLVKTELS